MDGRTERLRIRFAAHVGCKKREMKMYNVNKAGEWCMSESRRDAFSVLQGNWWS